MPVSSRPVINANLIGAVGYDQSCVSEQLLRPQLTYVR